MKRCSNCFQSKPLSAFYRKLSGLQSRCKTCNAEVVRAYARRKQHPWKQFERSKDLA